MDPVGYNKKAWDHQVRSGNRWTVPVDEKEISLARTGVWSVVLTPARAVPMEWFPQTNGLFDGTRILALASGGGQQVPILAAAGAAVTVFDNSPLQLRQDRLVAERENLVLTTVEGDMRDLSVFGNEAFDLVFHPCSNSFVPQIQPVWNEAFRVLKKGGAMLSGFVNPILYAVDPELDRKGIAQLKYPTPYSDLTSLTDHERARFIDGNEPLCFGHSLEDQLGGQMKAGFSLTGLYEDRWGSGAEDAGALDGFMPCFIATRAIKP